MLILSLLALPLQAQWTPGKVYREYIWVTPADHDEAFLRVGGRYGYAAQPGKLPDSLAQGDRLIFPQSIDLQGAIRTTLTFERVQSHEDSKDLTVAVNDHAPIPVPQPAALPDSAAEYMYHTEVTVALPPVQWKPGTGNSIQLKLSDEQRWGWPQNLFYAIILRVYYDEETAGPSVDYAYERVPTESYLRIANPRPDDEAADYIFIGRDTDWSGRGRQERKHWQTYRGKPLHTLGHSERLSDGFAVAWNTAWLPDQEDFAVQARVRGSDGKYRVGPTQEGLRLAPRPYRVKAYAPDDVPRNWVTRSGEFSQTITVGDSIGRATAFQLAWVSWSPCYSNGVFLNGHLVWDRTDDCYVFDTHDPTYTGHAVRYLEQGINTVSTALTPRFRGQMVHGMEVQYPGMQLKVRFNN